MRGVRFEIVSSYSGVEFIASNGNARPRYTERTTRSISLPRTWSLASHGTLFLPYTKERRKPVVPHFSPALPVLATALRPAQRRYFSSCLLQTTSPAVPVPPHRKVTAVTATCRQPTLLVSFSSLVIDCGPD
jgi:hypothetical protein